MPDQYHHHSNKDDNVEEEDGKDGSQESSKEHTSVANEAAEGYKLKVSGMMYLLLNNFQIRFLTILVLDQ